MTQSFFSDMLLALSLRELDLKILLPCFFAILIKKQV